MSCYDGRVRNIVRTKNQNARLLHCIRGGDCMAFLEVKDLTRIYGKKDNTLTALDHVSFSIEKGNLLRSQEPAAPANPRCFICLAQWMSRRREVSFWRRERSGTAGSKALRIPAQKDRFCISGVQSCAVLNVEENIQMPVRLDGKRMDPQYLEQLLKILGLTDRRYHLPESFPEARSREWRSGERLPIVRVCCWRMSRPVIWITRTGWRLCRC